MNRDNFEGVRYFFSLALEDYLGDMEELMSMADINDETLHEFCEMELPAPTEAVCDSLRFIQREKNRRMYFIGTCLSC